MNQESSIEGLNMLNSNLNNLLESYNIELKRNIFHLNFNKVYKKLR